jgi:hypothetical protein
MVLENHIIVYFAVAQIILKAALIILDPNRVVFLSDQVFDDRVHWQKSKIWAAANFAFCGVCSG